MDAEQVEVLRKGEEILERAHEVAQRVEEKTQELLHGGAPPDPGGREEGTLTDAI